MRLFDTHAHLLDGQFDEDREALIRALPEAGVINTMEACCSKADFPRMIELVEGHSMIYGSVGIHPENAEEFSPAVLEEMGRLLAHPKILAVGEIGLDYHYEDAAPREVQKAMFIEQLRLAKRHRLPVIIHDRDAHGDMMEILRAERDGLSGIMHCFSGSFEMAKDCINDGLYIAFGGALTFHNARRQREIAQKLPLDRLLIETDCPYMTPEPFRGKRNDPRRIKNTLLVLAEIKNMEPEAMAAALERNSRAVFQLSGVDKS